MKLLISAASVILTVFLAGCVAEPVVGVPVDLECHLVLCMSSLPIYVQVWSIYGITMSIMVGDGTTRKTDGIVVGDNL